MGYRRRITFTLVIGGLLTLGGVALAAHSFIDVPDDHIFHEDVEWLAENDVTRGCNPPANTRFCPDDPVTRGQMAAFMHRFADNVGTSGEQGPEGPAGSPGEQGPQGEQGSAGQALVATRLTPENPTYGGLTVVDVSHVPLGSGAPTASEGTELFDPVELEAGTYKLEGVVQFFDFGGTEAGTEYGVARSFLDDDALGSLWTADIPDDGNNAAQASGVIVVEVPSGGATLTMRAIIRGEEAEGGQAGANLIVTRFND